MLDTVQAVELKRTQTPKKHEACDDSHTSAIGPFTVVASDMDGTILNPQYTLSLMTKNLLYDLLTLGVHIVIATGRHHLCVNSIKNDLLLHFRNLRQSKGETTSMQRDMGLYIISANGARVHNMAGKVIVEQNLDEHLVRSLYEWFAQREEGEDPSHVMSIAAYQTDIWWMNRTSSTTEQLMNKFGILPQVNPNFLNEFPTTGIGKLAFRCVNPTKLYQFEKDLKEKFGGRLEAELSSDVCLDVMALGVSKASALQKIGEVLSVDLAKDVIAFGDSMNDREMLSVVAKGCIMRNGQHRLKEALPHLEVIDSNAEDGVARKLKEVFQINDN